MIVYIETALLIVSMMAGVSWEIFVRNKNSAAYRFVSNVKNRKQSLAMSSFTMDHVGGERRGIIDNGMGEFDPIQVNPTVRPIDSLIKEYNNYHANWVEKVKQCLTKKEARFEVNGNNGML